MVSSVESPIKTIISSTTGSMERMASTMGKSLVTAFFMIVNPAIFMPAYFELQITENFCNLPIVLSKLWGKEIIFEL